MSRHLPASRRPLTALVAIALSMSLPVACTGDGSDEAGGGGEGGGEGQGGAQGGGQGGGGGSDEDGGATDGGADLPRFAAVGYGGRRIVSYDGTEWVNDQFDVVGGEDDDDQLRAVTYANGRFVAVGGSSIGRFMWSVDGNEWQQVTDADGWLGGVAYGNGVHVAVGGNGRRAISEDGETWETVDIDYVLHFRAVTFGNGVFVAVGDSGRRIRSTDGRNWTNDVSGGAGLSDVAYGNGYFVAVGGGGRKIRSADGITWEDDVTSGYAGAIVFAQGRFLAVGGGTAYTSPDGKTWTPHELARAVDLVAYADGVYAGAAWSPSGPTFVRSTDGLEWDDVQSGGNNLKDMVGVSRQ